MDSMEKEKVGPILASTQCRFKFPLSYPDRVIIGTYISDLEEDRLLMNYGVYSLNHQRTSAVGDGLIVCFDYRKNEKTPLPEAIVKAVKEGIA